MQTFRHEFRAVLLAKIRSASAIALFLTPSVLWASPVAFPGAQGFGSVATGGRGDTVYHVTNLNDSGTGSFRDAVSASNRTIVFDVGGYVQLLSDVSAQSNLTIAGQTAPGQGFGVFGAEVSFSGSSNCIVRHMRFRDGSLDPNWPGLTGTSSHTNCLGMATTNNMIFDHCSMEFAAYNNIDAVGSVNLTFQNCIIADPIKYQQFNFHFETGPGTFINDIFANAHNRSILGKANLQFVNNVVYDYEAGFTTGNSSGAFNYDMINNYFIAGPVTSSPSDAFFQVDNNQSAYASGNFIDGSTDGVLNGSSVTTVGSANALSSYYFTSANTTTPTSSLPIVSAATAVTNDLANSGALPRDQVDAQVISQVASLGTSGKLFSTQADTGLTNSGYGTIDGGANPIDSDGDGMPDYWETAKGLNPNSATDGAALAADGSGYTNLEEYLNWLAGPHAVSQKNGSVQIDLSQYTTGLTTPTYVVTALTTGTALPVGVGGSVTTNSGAVTVAGSIATYTPASGTVGLGGFTFTATGSNGTITNTVYVCTSATSQPVSVTWKGDGTANSWDNTNANNLVWSTGTSNVAWTQGDTATLDDTGSRSPSINLASPIVAGAVTISTINNYTLTGTGSLGGASTLTVNGYGTGSLTFSNTGSNTFTGGVSITDATVSLNSSASLGTGPLTLNNATLVYTSSSLSLENSAITVNTASNINMPHNGGSAFINASISGSSPLNISLNGTTGTLAGVMSGFTSTINVIGPGNCRIDNGISNSANWGVSGGTLSITGGAGLNNRATAAATIPLGALTGVAGTTLNGSDQAGGSAGLVDNYNIGVLNTSTTFAGAIGNGTGATNPHVTAITKVGTGALTLSGSSTYKGTTTVTGGTLIVTGTLANTSTVSVASGCSLLGTGTIGTTTNGAVTMAAASTTTTLSPGSAVGAFGTLTVGNGLTLNSTTIPLNLSNNPSGTNDNIQLQGGALTLTGTSPLQLTLSNGTLGAGVYTLIGGGTSTTGTVSNLSSNLPTGTRQTLALSVPAGKVLLTVTGSAAPLIWAGGTTGGVWDLDTTKDWTNTNNAGAADYFFNLDPITFNDTTTNGAVTLSGTVQPAGITVTNSATNYTFSGTGLIAGPTALTKNGTSTLTISNTGVNTFAGGVTVNAGTVDITVGTGLGSGTVTLNGGALTFGASGLTVGNSVNVTAPSTWNVNSNSTTYWGGTLTGSSPLTMNIGSIFTPTGNWAAFNSTVNLSGTLRFNQGTNSWGSSTTAFNLGSTGSLYNRALSDVTINLGSLAGNSGSVLHGSDQAGPGVDTYVIGALNTSTSFAGAISDGSNGTSPHSVAITKVGTGSLTLNGASTYSGSTIVQGGTLIVGGSITSGSGSTIEVTSGTSLSLTGGSLTADSIVIDAGGSLSGGGSLNGALSVTNNGTITASTGGTFTMTGQVVNNGTLRLTNGTALNATGPFINNGTLDLTQGGQTLPANLVNNGQILYAPTNTDTPTMPEWALGILAMLLIFAAGPALTKKCA